MNATRCPIPESWLTLDFMFSNLEKKKKGRRVYDKLFIHQCHQPTPGLAARKVVFEYRGMGWWVIITYHQFEWRDRIQKSVSAPQDMIESVINHQVVNINVCYEKCSPLH